MMFKRLTIELTNHCNLACEICPRHHVNMELGYMNEDLFCKLIDQLPEHTTILPFWRGESLLHPELPKLLSYAIYRRMDIVLATNGYYLSNSTLPPDVLTNISVINISLHNMNSLGGYLWLLNQPDHPEICVSMVEGERNNIPNELLSFIPDMRIYKEHTKSGYWGLVSPNKTQPQSWCSRLDTDLIITWDGKVSRCCYVWEPFHMLNANTQTLRDIWHSSQMLSIRANYPDGVCQRCDQWRGSGKTL